MTHDTTQRRRALAVLAGGLVLGVGAAVTLAAWNDSEFAKGSFTAGSFNLEGSTDNTNYAEHPTDGAAAAVNFSGNFGNLSPGDKVAAKFFVRLDAATTSTATLMAAGVATGSTANDAHLSYSVHALGVSDTCDTSVTGNVVASGATLNALTAGTAPTLDIGTGSNAGAPVQLCVVVTAGSGLVQGGAANATWQFQATSV